jgi:anti-sigma regulatory factor (Ser/Thr protein kinase)
MPRSADDACTTPSAKPSAGTARMQLTLARSVQAPALARAAVMRHCDELELDASLAQSLILLVSEVVSNAVRHSAADASEPIEFVASFGERTIRIAVTDAGEGFTLRPREPGSTRDGYGLYLLEKVADRWGAEFDAGTKVWFELPRAATS